MVWMSLRARARIGAPTQNGNYGADFEKNVEIFEYLLQKKPSD